MQAENKNRDLETLVAELNKSDVRKYTCINDFGYSQLERDIVDKVTKPYKETISSLAKALQDMIDLAADVIGQYNDLGDGENEDEDWQPRLQKAAQTLREAGLTNE